MNEDYSNDRFALNLADDRRILSATYERFAAPGMPLVDELPEGDIYEYIYNEDGTYTHDPLPKPEVDDTPTGAEDTAAMLVDHEYRLTLLELGLTEY